MSPTATRSSTPALRAKDAIERMGSALLTQHPNPDQIDLDRLYFELRIVLLRTFILDRVDRLDEIMTGDVWTTVLELDLESELFHMEHHDAIYAQDDGDRIWSRDWVELLSNEFSECGGDWFSEALGMIREDACEFGAIDESLMGWSPRFIQESDDRFGLELINDESSARKLGGVFYTPMSLVGYVLDQTLSPAINSCGDDVEALLKLRVCDPACGCGYFLIEAARRIGERICDVGGGDRMGEVVSRCVMGGDVNPVTAEVCRWALWFAGGQPSVTIESLRLQIRSGDSLVDDVFEDGAFDVAVGNPPFLNQLGSGTARSGDRVRVLRDRGLVGSAAYTDEASAFFVLGLGLVRDGGRVCMVQPQSVLATRGGAWMRTRSVEVGQLESLWVSNAHVFGDASVYTCAPCVHVGGDVDDALLIDRYSGIGFDRHPAMEIGRESFGLLETWSSVAAVTMGTPEITLETPGVVGDVATATADFRDEYYGLAGKLVEDAECTDGDGSVRVVTTGLVDLGVCRWGMRATRILKQRWEAPRVSRVAIDGDERLARWVAARRVKKVLVATQTRVVEAYVDDGEGFVAVTPMISVMLADPGLVDVWKLGAAIGSPVCSAYAMRHYGGAAMHADALKMSARQVMGLPLPVDAGAWAEGARAFERVHAAARVETGYGSALVDFGTVMCSAYGIEGVKMDTMMSWWLGRLGVDQPK